MSALGHHGDKLTIYETLAFLSSFLMKTGEQHLIHPVIHANMHKHKTGNVHINTGITTHKQLDVHTCMKFGSNAHYV